MARYEIKQSYKVQYLRIYEDIGTSSLIISSGEQFQFPTFELIINATVDLTNGNFDCMLYNFDDEQRIYSHSSNELKFNEKK